MKAPLSDVWDVYLDRVDRTEKTFKDLNQSCIHVLKEMLGIDIMLWELLKARNETLPPDKTFVSIYYRRNIFYLFSAHALAAMAFCDPSMNIQRTVYESILRGYFFIVNKREAKRYYENFGTEDEERDRRRYGHGILIRRLFKRETGKRFRELYGELCRFAHPDFKGSFRDFPNYDEKRVEDRLKFILALGYGNIQMVAEGFLDTLNPTLKTLLRDILRDLKITLSGEIPAFEPDKDVYSSKIMLKRGTFENILT